MNLDDAVSAVCTITKGDLPIHIWWTLVDDFHGYEKNLSTNDGLMITRNSQKISMLAIDAVKARHRGNYTCYAKNKAGISKHSAFLFINGDLILQLGFNEIFTQYQTFQPLKNFANCFPPCSTTLPMNPF